MVISGHEHLDILCWPEINLIPYSYPQVFRVNHLLTCNKVGGEGAILLWTVVRKPEKDPFCLHLNLNVRSGGGLTFISLGCLCLNPFQTNHPVSKDRETHRCFFSKLFLHLYCGQASMLMTVSFSPAHRLAPNSHWVIVLSTPASPELTHRGAESVGHSDTF